MNPVQLSADWCEVLHVSSAMRKLLRACAVVEHNFDKISEIFERNMAEIEKLKAEQNWKEALVTVKNLRRLLALFIELCDSGGDDALMEVIFVNSKIISDIAWDMRNRVAASKGQTLTVVAKFSDKMDEQAQSKFSHAAGLRDKMLDFKKQCDRFLEELATAQ